MLASGAPPASLTHWSAGSHGLAKARLPRCCGAGPRGARRWQGLGAYNRAQTSGVASVVWPSDQLGPFKPELVLGEKNVPNTVTPTQACP